MRQATRWFLIGCLFLGTFKITVAQSSTPIADTSHVTLDFPRKVTFSERFSDADNIQQIILEYGVAKRTCGNVSAEAFPDFTSGSTIAVNWTWEMLKSGSEPPGATIWYQWKVVLKDGTTVTTNKATFVWLDNSLSWSVLNSNNLILHWYAGSNDFAESLLDAATNGLQSLAKSTGLVPQSPIDIYIFKDYADLRAAVFYQPGWIGGLAYPAYNITALGISTSNLAWGERCCCT